MSPGRSDSSPTRHQRRHEKVQSEKPERDGSPCRSGPTEQTPPRTFVQCAARQTDRYVS